jgi:hypothetical protein
VANGELYVSVKGAVALALADEACTETTGSAVSGMTSAAVKDPEAFAVNAAVLAPAVTVPEVLLGKPVPVTVTDVPAGPEPGLRLIDGLSGAAAAFRGAAAGRAHAMTASTPTSSLTSFMDPPFPR